MTASEQLRRRVKATWPTRYRETINKALAAFDQLAAKRADLAKNDDLSAVGRQKLIVEFVGKTAGSELATAVLRADLSRQKVTADRTAMLSEATAKDTSFGAEIRAFLRGKPLSEIATFLIGEKADRQAQIAVLSAPSFLSGVPADLLEKVRANYLSATHGAAVTSLDEADEAVDMVDTAIALLKREVSDAMTFSSDIAFQKWFDDTFVVGAADVGKVTDWLSNCDGLDRQEARRAAA